MQLGSCGCGALFPLLRQSPVAAKPARHVIADTLKGMLTCCSWHAIRRRPLPHEAGARRGLPLSAPKGCAFVATACASASGACLCDPAPTRLLWRKEQTHERDVAWLCRLLHDQNLPPQCVKGRRDLCQCPQKGLDKGEPFHLFHLQIDQLYSISRDTCDITLVYSSESMFEHQSLRIANISGILLARRTWGCGTCWWSSAAC